MSSRVVLGVSGGIAAYKACEVLRGLTEAGHQVTVVPTESALRFVGAPTWEALSGRPVVTGLWSDVPSVNHVRLGQEADLVLVVPATADLMARAVHGRANDLLAATLLTAKCPVVLAPAMHTEMWEHEATRSNVATLRERGVVVLEPAVGRLTGADSGPGRLPEPMEIVEVARRVLARAGVPQPLDLLGRRVLISAGGTREPIDPVRFLGNRSSGLQGWALARTAAARGAVVTLVAANVVLPDPAGSTVMRVGTAAELDEAMRALASDADAVVMAAAVADVRPVGVAVAKIKLGHTEGAPRPLALERTADVLSGIVDRRPPGQVVVGFAAETGDASGDALAHGRAKLQRKGCDLLVVNDVSAGRGFEVADNAAVILGSDGSSTDVPLGPKEALADAIWDLVTPLLNETR